MKHKYKKTLICLQWLLVIFIFMSLIFVYWLLGVEEKTLLKATFGAFAITFFMCAKYSHEMANRYVEFFDDCIRFYSFRFKNVRIKDVASFNIKYEDIYSVEARRLPFIGVWAIYVDGKGIPHKISLSFCFTKHKELIRNLCNYVKQYNPDAYIDSHLIKYTEE